MNIHDSSYSIYNKKYHEKVKVNTLDDLYPVLPDKKYSVIYADPPWHYNGKMQFDKTGNSDKNIGWKNDIFVSAATFKYPTLKTSELKNLAVPDIAENDCLLFMWSTNPHLAQAIELGNAWGFEYKTVAFVWDKMVHNPGQYTLSYCELCLLFKKGRIPQPRGARNIKQLVRQPRTKHSEKPFNIAQNIQSMFPTQQKIELFARHKNPDWDSWGLDFEDKSNQAGTLNVDQNDLLFA